MTAAMKRDQLITYLAKANENKVAALYALLENDINDGNTTAVFTQQQLDILNDRSASLLNGKDKGIDWRTMHDNIRAKR